MYKIELTRTKTKEDWDESPVRSASKALKLVLPLFNESDSWREKCYAVFLDGQYRPIGFFHVGTGDDHCVTMGIKPIVAAALGCLARGVILTHNHPSGNEKPGSMDIKQTEDIKKALSIFDIDLIDHIIIGDKNYYSFEEEVSKPIEIN